MTDLPNRVVIQEEGPREGFQFESAQIPTARKIELIDRLSDTGLRHIQVVSFVSPKLVPGMADAEDVTRGITPRAGVAYTALWLNEKGFGRALDAGTIEVKGYLTLSASPAFLKRNQNRTAPEYLAAQRALARRYKQHGIEMERGSIMAAFGCNFGGDVPVSRVLGSIAQLLDIAAENAAPLKYVLLADTMAWATPQSIKRMLGAARERYPDVEFALHLHDTRGMGIANAYAGLEMGVRRYDASVGGLGGCPFAGHRGAAGNVCTEDFVFMCHEMGIETGVDLEALIDCARRAEDIVGHPLPGSVMRGGSLASLRARR
ncbi:MAG TPA: hydroxymethylglutaryl-CoA lyase [Xanthobacteraceae bacterium]|jgi:hydroxymethylglutaryl-CoA lyase